MTPNQNTPVTFTITATNNGPSNATGVQVTDLLPAGLALVSATPSPGTTYVAGIWDVGALNNGSSATLLIIATVTGTTAVTNTAAKTGALQPDPVPGNNSASATVIGQAADIAITKTVSNATPTVGSNVTFLVTAQNNGPSAATGVQVTDSLPAGVTLVSATPSAGTTYLAGLWVIGAMANGASASLSIVATVTRTTAATNTATKTAEDQPDSNPGNDSSSATVTGASAIVTGASADISVAKTVNTTTPTIGQNVTYTIVVNNLGPSAAGGVQVSDVLPASVAFVSYTATQGAYNSTTGVWLIGAMANGSTTTLSLTVRIGSLGATVNTATVSGGPYFDPNLTNNVSSAALMALPGLPNTSAPNNSAATPMQVAPERRAGLLVVVLSLVAGLGMLSLAGIRRRPAPTRFRTRPSRSQQLSRSGRLGGGMLAVLLSLGLAPSAVGEVASYAHPAPTVTALVPGTELIGGKIVDVAPPEPPEPPKAETFNRVTGPITPSRLRIPVIGVDAWVGAVGLRSDGSMDVPNNLWTSSWLATGPKPGQPGNAVIAAHRGVGSPALFSHLENVQPGDTIYVSDAAGNEIAYSVTAVVALDLSLSSQREVFAPATAQQLVLITCFGRYIPNARTYDHRLVVVGQPLA
jgi:LPXTG-site transpeptidase (sortase) family protein